MGPRTRDLTVETLEDVWRPCRSCVFWELPAAARLAALEEDPEFEKEAWVSEVGLVHGRCGAVAYQDERPVGFALYGPADAFQGADAFPARVSRDALFLAVVRVLDGREGQGVGKALVQAALREAKDRGKRAVEAFGDKAWRHPACIVPAGFLESVGFKVRRQHPRFPLMRIDVRSLATLADEAAAAVEAFLGSVFGPEPATRPAR